MPDAPSAIYLLPETDDATVCVRLDGTVTEAAFDRVFLDAVRARMDHKDFGALLYFHCHRGWEEKAAALSLDSILRYAVKARRIAYVNPPPGKILQVKLFQTRMPGEIRIYGEEDYGRAVRWVKTGTE